MRMLSPDNSSFPMNTLPDVTEEPLYYCVLDYSSQSSTGGKNKNDTQDTVDFVFLPLVYREQYQSPSVDLRIGKYRIQMPLDWSVVIADKNSGSMEIIELKQLNDRPFLAFVMNPINGFMPQFEEISIENLYPNVGWVVPKLKNGHILAVPLLDTKSPPCAMFVRETSKISEILDITKIFS